MASSFIDFKEKGFWIKDFSLEIALSFIYKNMTDNSNEWEKEFRENIRNNASGYYSSYMHLDFDLFLNDEEKKEVFLGVLEKTKLNMQSKGDIIDLMILDDIMNFSKGSYMMNGTDFPTHRIVKVIDRLAMLVRGELNTTVSDNEEFF